MRSPELGEKKYCCFKASSLWYFVKAAPGQEHAIPLPVPGGTVLSPWSTYHYRPGPLGSVLGGQQAMSHSNSTEE